jgi:cytochrome c
MKMNIALIGAALLLSACGSKPKELAEAEPSATPGAVTAAISTAPASFAMCSTCHSVTKDGSAGVGPNLYAIIGKKAGGAPGFNYSTALKESGLIWDEATLEKFVESPRGVIAGTRMSYGGQRDPAKRKEIIDWLKKNS